MNSNAMNPNTSNAAGPKRGAASAGPWRTGPFTRELWETATPIMERVREMPFLTGLAEGTLDPEVFVDYLCQDAHYLSGYSRALATLAAKAPTAEAGEFWAGGACTAVAEEKTLHRDLMADARLTRVPRPAAPSVTTRGYIGTLLAATAFESYEVGAAAVLPCFWVYADVGAHLAERLGDVADHPYARWVREYGDPEFLEATNAAIALVEAAAEATGPAGRERMREVFLDAARFEELFWEAPWHREAWDPGL